MLTKTRVALSANRFLRQIPDEHQIQRLQNKYKKNSTMQTFIQHFGLVAFQKTEKHIFIVGEKNQEGFGQLRSEWKCRKSEFVESRLCQVRFISFFLFFFSANVTVFIDSPYAERVSTIEQIPDDAKEGTKISSRLRIEKIMFSKTVYNNIYVSYNNNNSYLGYKKMI